MYGPIFRGKKVLNKKKKNENKSKHTVLPESFVFNRYS